MPLDTHVRCVAVPILPVPPGDEIMVGACLNGLGTMHHARLTIFASMGIFPNQKPIAHHP